MGATIAQWICLCLPSYRPGFKSQAHHQCYYQFVFELCHVEKTKINEKEAGIGPFKKIIRNSANTVTLRTDKERHEAKEERGFRNKKLESLRKH